MQWRRRELNYTCEQINPSAIFVVRDSMDNVQRGWLDQMFAGRAQLEVRVSLSADPPEGWLRWSDLDDAQQATSALDQIAARQFQFDEVSLITASSGTSSLAKLNEWPEAAQVCIGHGTVPRLGVTGEDNIGMFAPMAGASPRRGSGRRWRGVP